MVSVRRSLASVGLLLAALVTGCATSAGCPGFVSYATPADAMMDADTVVVGAVVEQAGTAPIFGGTANVWTVEVDDWAKGDGPGRIEVVSTPPQCSGDDMYFGADPFAVAQTTDAEVALFLHDEGGRWRTLTPGQGIVPTDAGAVPDAWPGPPGTPAPSPEPSGA